MRLSEAPSPSSAANPAADLRAKNAARHELTYTLITGAIGLAMGATATYLVREGMLPMLWGPLTLPRAALEIVVYVVCFDAYFYALHRLLHVRSLYQKIHVVHHRSTSPTLMTALAFHPVESMAILGFIPMMMMVFPIHLLSLVVVSVFLSGSIAVAHCGYEVFPRWWQQVPVLNWYVTPRVHDAHHKRRDCNYAATLSIFDRVFRTLRADDSPEATK